MANGLNTSWPWNTMMLIGLVILCVLYIIGIRQTHKGKDQNTHLKKRHIGAFIIAVVLMSLVFLTPLNTIARTHLFSAHMLQAVTLTTLCAPLLLLACPAWLLRPFVDKPFVRSLAHALTQPVVASIIFNISFLTWHIPSLFHFALLHQTIYNLALFTFLIIALLNWWPLIGPVRELHNLTYPEQMLYAFLDYFGLPKLNRKQGSLTNVVRS